MLSALPLALSSAAAAHRRPQWTSPRAPPSWQQQRFRRRCRPSVLNQGQRRVRRRVGGVRRRVHWPIRGRCGESAAASMLLPPHCRRCAVRHRRALVAPPTLQPPTRRRQAAANVALSRCRCRCRCRRAAAKLLPSCCNCAAAIALCTATTLCATATTADAAAPAVLPPSFRAPSLVRSILDLRAQCVGCLNFWQEEVRHGVGIA